MNWLHRNYEISTRPGGYFSRVREFFPAGTFGEEEAPTGPIQSIGFGLCHGSCCHDLLTTTALRWEGAGPDWEPDVRPIGFDRDAEEKRKIACKAIDEAEARRKILAAKRDRIPGSWGPASPVLRCRPSGSGAQWDRIPNANAVDKSTRLTDIRWGDLKYCWNGSRDNLIRAWSLEVMLNGLGFTEQSAVNYVLNRFTALKSPADAVVCSFGNSYITPWRFESMEPEGYVAIKNGMAFL